MVTPSRRRFLVSITTAAASVGSGCSFTVPDAPRDDSTETRTMYGYHGDREFSDEVRDRAGRVGAELRRAVVEVSAFGDSKGVSGGTGWFIDENHVFTNAHVVDTANGNRETTVQIRTWDDTEAQAEIVGSRYGSDDDGYRVDLALLNVDVSPPATVSLGDSDELTRAQPLVQVGHPTGFDDWMIALGRYARSGRGGRITAEIPMESGNSGSPLATLDGNIIGISAGTVGKRPTSTPSPRPNGDKNSTGTATPRVWTEYPYQGDLLVSGMSSFVIRRYYDRWR